MLRSNALAPVQLGNGVGQAIGLLWPVKVFDDPFGDCHVVCGGTNDDGVLSGYQHNVVRGGKGIANGGRYFVGIIRHAEVVIVPVESVEIEGSDRLIPWLRSSRRRLRQCAERTEC